MEEANQTPSLPDKLKTLFSSPQMCAVAVLLTVQQAFALLTGMGFAKIDIFSILLTVAAWIVYSSAKKGKQSLTGLSLFSGVEKARCIVYFVLTGILTVCGVALFIFSAEAKSDVLPQLVKTVTGALAEQNDLLGFLGLYGVSAQNIVVDILLSYLLSVLGVPFLIGALVCGLLGACYGRLNRFTKSLCLSANSDEQRLAKVSFAKVLMISLAVSDILVASGSLLFIIFAFGSFVRFGTSAAVHVLLYNMIRKIE